MKNPNKDFDSIIWKPKSKFLKRFVVRYVYWIEKIGYAFAIFLASLVIAVWVVKANVFMDAQGDRKKNERKLLPFSTQQTSKKAGSFVAYLFKKGEEVEKGQPLVVIKTMDALDTIKASTEGFAYPNVNDSKKSFESPDSSTQKGAGKPWAQIVDFSRATIKVKFKGGILDSINRLDSAKIKVEAPGDLALSLDIETPDESYFGEISESSLKKVQDELKKSFIGMDATAKGEGVFTVTEVEELSLVVNGKGTPSEKPTSTFEMIPQDEFWGVLDSGVHLIKIEMLKNFKPEIEKTANEWATKKLKNQTVLGKDGSIQINEIKEVQLKALLKCTTSLTIPIPFKVRNKKMKEGFEKERTVEGRVFINKVPHSVQMMAKTFFEMSPNQYLDANVKLLTHRISWGKRLIGGGKGNASGGSASSSD